MVSTLRAAMILLVVLGAGALLGSAITQWSPGEYEDEPVAVQRQVGERIRVEVLNAGGRRDMARRATGILRNAGFDVVYFGNAERFDEERSEVLDRVGRNAPARAVAEALGIADVRSDVDRDLLLDVTVRLGADWTPGAATPDTGRADSWDPGALLRGLRER